ncbi:hypothetical protein N339_07050, partial [Pterocles gutturalis]
PILQRRKGHKESTYTIILTFCFVESVSPMWDTELLGDTVSFQDRLEIQKMPVTFLQDHR